MTSFSKSQRASRATQRAARAFTRRQLLKSAAAAGAVVAAGPAIVRDAFSSSGEINILMWSDYLPEPFIKSFTDATGITVNYTGIGSNEEIINKMKATQGQGFDIVSPTNMRSLQWEPLELLQPFDYGRIPNLENVNPAMLQVGDTEWNFAGKGSHWLPHIWGTEAIGWRIDQWAPADGIPSYGDVWDDANAGKTMGRPHSMMLGAGLYMERIGELEAGAMRKAYESEETMRPIWQKVTDFCVSKKGNIKLFWNDADTQKNGLLNEGVVVGQTWDGPPLAMKTDGEPVTYQAPKEGALAWVDGMSIPVGAANVDQIYAFLEFAFQPQPAGAAIDHHGYNSAVLGADAHAGDQYKKNFTEAYPGEALSNLWPWPKEPVWYAEVRTEYRNKFVNA
ncbi:MAG: extracellular solute-binding protein [Alphaproteobacteria bacterium]|nr:extracellular solute-binding protein [Alphaproteobacteria bacterium]